MIGFCEECGKKNTLAPEAIKNRSLAYRCHHCNHMNIRTLPDKNNLKETKKTNTPEIETSGIGASVLKVMDNMNSCSQVEGSFMVHSRDKCLFFKQAQTFSLTESTCLARIVSKQFSLGRSSFPDISSLMMVLKNRGILCSPITENAFLAVVLYSYPLTASTTEKVRQAKDRLQELFSEDPKT